MPNTLLHCNQRLLTFKFTITKSSTNEVIILFLPDASVTYSERYFQNINKINANMESFRKKIASYCRQKPQPSQWVRLERAFVEKTCIGFSDGEFKIFKTPKDRKSVDISTVVGRWEEKGNKL